MGIRLLTAVALTLAEAANAGTPEPVALRPMALSDASLTVVSPDGSEAIYTPSDIERLPTYRLDTTTPWRDEPAIFDGAMLTDILEANGLSDMPAIRVIAENDYAVIFTNDVWSEVPILVATRVNDQPHTRRARGPIQFVIDMDTYEQSEIAGERHLVWMAARIEPAD